MISRCSEARDRATNRSEWSSERATDHTNGANRRKAATSMDAMRTAFLVCTGRVAVAWDVAFGTAPVVSGGTGFPPPTAPGMSVPVGPRRGGHVIDGGRCGVRRADGWTSRRIVAAQIRQPFPPRDGTHGRLRSPGGSNICGSQGRHRHVGACSDARESVPEWPADCTAFGVLNVPAGGAAVAGF
jgi:hypothetical protein